MIKIDGNLMTPKKLVLALAVQAVIAGNAIAQLEEIVVTAQKREQSLIEVPLSVEVISAQDIERGSVTDARDLFTFSPTLSFTEGFNSSASAIAIRGVSSLAITGGLQPSVVMIIDDVSYARSGEFLIDMADIERIEILRGPQGTLIGKNATAGALNISTRRPTDTFEASIEASVTDETEQTYKGFVSGPITDSIRYRVNGFYRELDDIIDNFNSSGLSDSGIGGYDSHGARGQLEVDFSDSVSLRLIADYRKYDGSTGQLQVVTPRTGDTAQHISEIGFTPKAEQDFIDIDAKVYSDHKAKGVSAELNWEINEQFSLKSITAYREFDEDSNNDTDSTPFGTTSGGTFINYFDMGSNRAPKNQDYFSQEFRLHMNLENVTAILGAYYSDFSEDIFNQVPFAIPEFGIVNDGGVVKASGDNETVAVFADATYDFTENWSVFGGLRYTDEDVNSKNLIFPVVTPFQATLEETREAHRANINAVLADPPANDPAAGVANYKSDTDEQKVTGRFGVSYNFDDGNSAYLSYSTGYKGPGINLSRAAFDPDKAILDSEDAESIELGFKGQFLDDNLYVGAAIFHLEVDNLQTSQLIPGTITTELVNAGKLKSDGLEVEFKAALSEALTVTGGFVYLDAVSKGLKSGCWPGQIYATGCRAGGASEPAVPDTSSPDGLMQSQQNLSGQQVPLAPKFSFRLSANYDWMLANMPFDAYSRVDFSWRDSYDTELSRDPLVALDALPMLNVALGIEDKDGHYELSLFGKNITDEWNYGNLIEVNSLIGRVTGYTVRSSQAYWGVRARYSFF